MPASNDLTEKKLQGLFRAEQDVEVEIEGNF